MISPSQEPLLDNTQHSQETESMPPVGFEPAVPASERKQTHALDRTGCVIGTISFYKTLFF